MNAENVGCCKAVRLRRRGAGVVDAENAGWCKAVRLRRRGAGVVGWWSVSWRLWKNGLGGGKVLDVRL